LAEKVGLMDYAIRKTILSSPPSLVTYTVVFVGILGNLASDAAVVLIPPLAAMVFYKVGRHPLAGLAAGFAGAGAGFTANIFIAGTDAL
ncbi:AbgT family transporter, partial [Planococcus sp. SIMBA_143]